MSVPPQALRPPPPGPDRTGIDYELALKMLPNGELEELRKQVSAQFYNSQPASEWKKNIVVNRIQNAICNYCFKKEETPLRYCKNCHCTWFCTDFCEREDKIHKAWCCNPNSGPDTGPQRILVLEKGENAEWDESDMAPASDSAPFITKSEQVKLGQGVKMKPNKKLNAESEAMYRDAFERSIASGEAAMDELKLKGNECYKAKDFVTALHFYTAAVRTPTLTHQVSKLRVDCWMNRSKAFAAMEFWHLALSCVNAVELGLGMPLHNHGYIHHMHTKINYLVKLKMYDEALKVYKQGNTMYVTDEYKQKWLREAAILEKVAAAAREKPNELEGAQIENARGVLTEEQKAELMKFQMQASVHYYPCHERFFEVFSLTPAESVVKYFKEMNEALDPATEVKPSLTGGKGMFAKQDFKKGAIVIQEDTQYIGSVATNRCYCCAKLMSQHKIIYCAQQCGEKYCSVACRDEAKATYHTWQCNKDIQEGIEKMRENCATGISMSSRTPMMMIRLLGFIPRTANVLESIAFLQQLNLGTVGNPLLMDIRYKDHLRECEKKKTKPVSKEEFARSSRPRVGLEQGFNQYARIMNVLRLNPAWFDYYTYDYLRFVLVNNTFAIATKDEIKANQPGFAMVAYKAISYINHACDYNCAYKFAPDDNGASQFLIADRDIKKGEELFISYIDVKQDYMTRQKALYQYNFECKCKLCEQQKLPAMLERMTPEERQLLLQEGFKTMEAVEQGQAEPDIVKFTKDLLLGAPKVELQFQAVKSTKVDEMD